MPTAPVRKGKTMDVMHERVAGLDVHKETIVRIMVGGKATRECRTFDTTTAGLEALLSWLTESGCTQVTQQMKAPKPVQASRAFCRVMCRNPRSSPDERRSWNRALLWVSGACVLGFLHEDQRPAGYSAAFCKGAARRICTRAKTLDGDPRQRSKLAEYDRRKPDSGRETPRGLFAEMGARVPSCPRLALVIAAPPLTGCAKILRFDGLEITADHTIFSDADADADAEARAAFSSRPAAVH
jgi:hypothetical protein